MNLSSTISVRKEEHLLGGNAADRAAQADLRVTRAVEQYLAALERGENPPREAFIARHPEIAAPLAECLEALDFIHHATDHLSAAPDGQCATQSGSIGVLGDFRILREIGRGGMGVVYEAEQISLGRRVALKVLPFASVLDKKQLQRFQNEARAAATLNHPNIVDIHGTGVERGVHYFAMQFIYGKTLAELIDELRERVGGSLRAPPDPALDAGLATPPKPPTNSSPAPPGDLIVRHRPLREVKLLLGDPSNESLQQ